MKKATVKMPLEQYNGLKDEISALCRRIEYLERCVRKSGEFDRKVEGLLYPLYKEARDEMREKFPVLEEHNQYRVSVPVNEILKLWTFDERYAEEKAEELAEIEKEEQRDE